MNINLRALVFGAAVSTALTLTMNSVVAAATPVHQLDPIEVVAHRNVDTTIEAVRLEPITIVAHKAN